MEIVKGARRGGHDRPARAGSEPADGGVADPVPERHGLLGRLLAWRASTRDLAHDKDPSLWRHRATA